jgi:RNA polymerase sigma factor (sigma-70 family)
MPVDWNEMIPTRKSLLSRLKHLDDHQSWQDFFDTYWRLICGAALKAGLTESEAEDVVQETVIAVTKALPTFRYQPEKCTFKSWLHSITKRKVADQFRRRLGKGRLLEPLPTSDTEENAVNDIPDPSSWASDELWERQWEDNLLHAARERVKTRVSPAQFQIYEFHVIQEHSVRETCNALGISAAKVYLAKHRILREEREELAKLRKKYA